MKKTLLGVMIGIAITGLIAMKSDFQEKDRSLARVEKMSGKLVFLNSEPVNDYDVAFEVQVTVMSNSQVNSLDKISNLIVTKALKISKDESKEFDAVIIKSGQKKDIAIKFK